MLVASSFSRLHRTWWWFCFASLANNKFDSIMTLMSLRTIAPAQDPDSSINIMHYMRNNVPFIMIMTMAMLNQYAFGSMDCTAGNKAGIILVFAVLTVVDVLWTVYHCHVDFTVNYPDSGSKWKRYAAIRAATSVLAMYSLNYFIHQGVPFNCFFGYDVVAANVVLYLSFATIATVSYIEHYYWKKLSIPLMPDNA